MDAMVKIINVKDAVGIDPRTATPIRDKEITYTVGTHGPFTLRVHETDYNDANVTAQIEQNVATLRAIGAIPASG